MSRLAPLATTLLLLSSAIPVFGQEQASGPLSDSALVSTIAVRSVGPAVMSGRVVDIAVASSSGTKGGSLGTVLYIAAASGGVWKSENGGISWDPIFDEDGGVGSIGAVAVAPSSSDIVWVGSGESNNQRSSSYGDGVYKSVDAGATFQHMGLRTSQHVAGIAIDPHDPNRVYVAATGPMWAAGGERGIYRSTDGGETWENVLSVDEHTGGTDIQIDPENPEILYAAMLQRERRAYSYVGGGPGSGIWKSTDGGDSWTELTQGLPESDMGRIGLSIAASQTRTVYAVIEGSEAGVYRTDNGGASWRRMSNIASIPWYFGEIRADPNDPETVWHLGVPLQLSTDGGANWERRATTVHVDHHALWINPENSRHLVLGNDGGLWVSYDQGVTFDFSPNLPISQFYAVGLDMAEPFFGIYGGLQDNNTWGGPSRTRYSVGIRNADWIRMAGGDGFYAAIDPTDSNIAYVESQNGNLSRYDRRTGQRKSIRPIPPQGEPSYRFNWSAPVKISPWDPSTIYFAANYAFKSTDRGDTWERLGEDLTRAIDRDSLPMFGEIPSARAVSRHQGTAVFSNISDLHVSSVQRGLLITGSDDGTIAISEDDGQTWTKQTRFPGVPDTTYVSKVRTSRHDASVMYATLDGHRSNDFRPHVIRSDDGGVSWTNIAANLPDFGSVRAFAEHHENPDLLFLGTEIAPYVSFDRGGSWTRITNGMPPVRVDDIRVHTRDNALVIATHGRGFYVIDDLGPFQHMAEAKASGEPYLFPVQSQWQIYPDNSVSTGTSADRDYRPENPPTGTHISYLLPAAARGATLEIVDGADEVIRTLDAASGRGIHHVLWDFRSDAAYSGPPEEQQQGGGFGGGFGFGGGGNQGVPVVAGSYTARLTIPGDSPVVMEQSVTVRKDPNVTLTDAELRHLYNIRRHQRELNARLTIALRSADDLRDQVREAKDAMEKTDVPESLEEMADGIEDDIGDVIRSLRGAGGGGFGGGGGSTGPRSVRQRLQTANGVHSAWAMPTAQEMEALDSVPEDLQAGVDAINEIVTTRMPAFLQALDDAGVPWTPGRPIG